MWNNGALGLYRDAEIRQFMDTEIIFFKYEIAKKYCQADEDTNLLHVYLWKLKLEIYYQTDTSLPIFTDHKVLNFFY